jgi:glycosyltransferase involved in cell wall biosynthesis
MGRSARLASHLAECGRRALARLVRRAGPDRRASAGRRVLIIVQNLPVPLDRRVWLECQALTAAGYQVCVISIRGPEDRAYQLLEGVHIYRYRPAPQARGALGYLWEFGYSWLMTALLSVRIARRHGFDVIQACNPPDTYWALAALYKPLGKRFVYDQHDLNPEVFLSRFGPKLGVVGRLQYRLLLWLERMTYRLADHVISTNESYRQVALDRGHRGGSDVTVVRSGPDTSLMRPVAGLAQLRKGRRYLAVYLGIMGPQDGVDVAIRALDTYVHRLGRTDLHLALLGFGDCLEDLQKLATDLGLDDFVTFTGRADARMITEYLSTADIGLSPDPLNPLNDVSTMNKTMEYMAFALPVVAFDLKETRVSAADAATYIEPGDVEAYAHAVAALLDDADRRAAMAVAGRERAAAVLDWEPQKRAYVGVYDRLMHRAPEGVDHGWPHIDRRTARATGPLTDRFGNPLVDLRNRSAVEQYVRSRELLGTADPEIADQLQSASGDSSDEPPDDMGSRSPG